MDIEIYIFLFLTFVTALFSGSESAIFSLTIDRLNNTTHHHKAKHGYKLNQISQWLKEPEKTISALLLGSLLLDILMSELGHSIILKNQWYYYIDPNLFAILALTFFLLIFGDIIPKVLGLKIAYIWNLFFFPILHKWFQFTNLVFWPIYKFIDTIISKIPYNPKKLNESDLLESIRLAQEYGVLKHEDEQFLKRSVIFHHDTVYSAMLPKERIFFLNKNESLPKTKKMFQKNMFRFAIVYQDAENNTNGITKRKILGYLHIRALLLIIAKKNKSFEHKIEPILFFPETMLLKDALSNLINNKMEIASVIDESGEFSGLITLQQLLSKLMGYTNVNDIVDHSTKNIKRIAPKTYRVLGKITLNEFNDFFKSNLHHEDIETISGYIIYCLDCFPKGATVLKINNLQFYDIHVNPNYTITDFLIKKNG